jgi:hypothetical protein
LPSAKAATPWVRARSARLLPNREAPGEVRMQKQQKQNAEVKVETVETKQGQRLRLATCRQFFSSRQREGWEREK